jgi:hypothetical protein
MPLRQQCAISGPTSKADNGIECHSAAAANVEFHRGIGKIAVATSASFAAPPARQAVRAMIDEPGSPYRRDQQGQRQAGDDAFWALILFGLLFALTIFWIVSHSGN